MLSTYVTMSAWREMLARIFADFIVQDNVSPKWLVNPATGRRLKLDKYYPDATIAIRFAGLTAKGQKRQSDWEILEAEQRDETRAELCRLNGVQLAVINLDEEPLKQLEILLRTLSRASRLLAQGSRPAAEKGRWMPLLSEARVQGEELYRRMGKDSEQMIATLAEAWRDRETGTVTSLSQAVEANGVAGSPSGPLDRTLSAGMRVRHVRFGEGVVTEIEHSGADQTISILFDAEEQRTFLVSLIQDKLEIVG